MTEVAEIMGVARSTAYLMANTGRLPVVRRRGRMFVPRAALAAWLAAESEAALENLSAHAPTNGHRAADQARTNKEPGGNPAQGKELLTNDQSTTGRSTRR